MTGFWSIIDAAGAVVCPSVQVDGDDAPDPAAYGGAAAVALAGPLDLSTAMWVDGAWGVDVARLRERRWEEVKAQREARRIVITTAFGPFDADEIAKTNLLGKLASFAQLGDAARDEVTWKLHDNSFVTLPRADFVAACMAVLAGVEAVYAASFALEFQLNAATTAAELDAIDIEQGWPA